MILMKSLQLREEFLGGKETVRSTDEKSLSTHYRKHAERTITRYGLPMSPRDLDLPPTRHFRPVFSPVL